MSNANSLITEFYSDNGVSINRGSCAPQNYPTTDSYIGIQALATTWSNSGCIDNLQIEEALEYVEDGENMIEKCLDKGKDSLRWWQWFKKRSVTKETSAVTDEWDRLYGKASAIALQGVSACTCC